MDIFSSMLGRDEDIPLKKKAGSGPPLVTRDGLAVKHNKASLLFFDDKAQTEIFIPYSQIRDWWYTDCPSNLNLEIAQIEPDDEITIVIPQWLARKEGLE